MSGDTADSKSAKEVAVRRKTAAQKDNIHMLRQQQISSYKTAMSKEARAQRSRLRHSTDGVSSDDGSTEDPVEVSPRKKKKVNFIIHAPKDVPKKAKDKGKSPK
ncbi:hypothetical protein OXX80_011025 [Metschnikowia pulcherrima]